MAASLLRKRLFASTAALSIAILPARAADERVFYRATSNVITYDATPSTGTGTTTPPASAEPLSVVVSGSLSVAYGAPVSFTIEPKGGVPSGWRMTYAGDRPANVSIAESGVDVAVSAPTGLPDATYPFKVSLTDGVSTIQSTVSLVVAPANPALAIAAPAAASTTVNAGSTWSLPFVVSGGKGPYSFATVALTGDLSTVTKSVSATGVTFSGTAPVGVYPIHVDATDAAGRTVRSSVSMTVQQPTGDTSRPSSLSYNASYVSIVEAVADLPDWHVLYDGLTTTSATATYGSTYPMALSFASAVTFSKIYVRQAGTSQITIYVREGTAWKAIKTINATAAGGAIDLGQSYTASEVAFSSAVAVQEFRVGDGAAALPPQLKTASPSVVPVGTGLVATSSSFETRSPYQPGAISLSDTPTSQNGVSLTVSAGQVSVSARPVHSTDVMVVAKSDDGLAVWQKMRIEGTGGAVETAVRPTSLVFDANYVSIVEAIADLPDWHVLYDGLTTTSATAAYGVTYPMALKFTAPVTFDRVYVKQAGTSQITIYLKDGTSWKAIKTANATSAGGVVVLDRFYTAGDVAFSSSLAVQEFRVGDGGVSLLAQLKATSPSVFPVGSDLVATTSSFEARSPYQAGAFSLSDTPTSQNGVSLTVSAGQVSVSARPAYTTDVMVVAKSDDGLAVWQKMTIEGSSGAIEPVVRPTSVTYNPSYVSTVKAVADLPEWHVLYDGLTTTSATASYGATYPMVLNFANPATFDRVYVKLAGTSQIGIYLKDGTSWKAIKTASVASAGGVVVLDRFYTAGEVVFTSGIAVQEFRVGGGAAALPPQLKATSTSTVAPGTDLVATSSSFETVSAYQAGAVSLSETPTSQNGATLSVSSGEVRVAVRPAKTVDVMVAAKSADGLTVWQKFRIEAVVGQASDMDRPVSLSYNPSYVSVAKTAAQPEWNALYDGVTTTSATASYGSTYPMAVNFANAATFDRVFVKQAGTSQMTIYLKDGTSWKAIKTANATSAGAVIVLERFYTAREIAFSSNLAVQEFRVGDVAAAVLP